MKIQSKRTDIQLDGSRGEGGGQILRSALSLSAITGKSFTLKNIRAGRRRPGLMRQHLTCVHSAAEVCGAVLPDGLAVGSTELHFHPGEIRASDATFAIGTAGSTGLLLQTVLPVLLHAPERSEVKFIGGTHALNAPCFEYIDEIFLPALRQTGGRAQVELRRAGFFPAGGGAVELTVEPSDLQPFEWNDSKPNLPLTAEVLLTPTVPESVAEKELNVVCRSLGIGKEKCATRSITDSASPGNVLLLRAGTAVGEVPGTLVAAFGEKNKPAANVAKEAVREMKRYLQSPAPVDEHLADQLMLPLALAGGGSFTASALTPHFHSNAEVIRAFLPEIQFQTERLDRFAWKVKVES